MKFPRRQFLQLAAGAAALPAVSPIARAQSYPTRPVTMVVPFPAGGPSDTIMRIIIERMRSSLGQAIIIENIAGAAGSIGTGRVARAAGDGYMLIAGEWGTHVVNGAVYALPYDVVSDFEPVAQHIGGRGVRRCETAFFSDRHVSDANFASSSANRRARACRLVSSVSWASFIR